MNLIRRLKSHFLRKKEIATMLQESGLSDKLANGDSEAWMTYIDLLTPHVKRSLEHLSNDPLKRDDALHEIYLAVFSSFGKLTRTERAKLNL